MGLSINLMGNPTCGHHRDCWLMDEVDQKRLWYTNINKIKKINATIINKNRISVVHKGAQISTKIKKLNTTIINKNRISVVCGTQISTKLKKIKYNNYQ